MTELTFTVHCSGCGDKFSTTGQHTNTFAFLDHARAQGWIIPAALENKPIECPKCSKKT